MNAVADIAATMPLGCAGLRVEVAGRELVRGLTLSMRSGTITSILGCNGAGKTLTLHTLAGLRPPSDGQVTVAAQPLMSWPRRLLARQIGLLTQTSDDPFPSTVLESVLIGRHPHIGFWSWESDADRRIALDALAAVALADAAQRDVTSLSGGERRRAAVATLLAQDPEVFLLDEPINHLDPHHQIQVLKLLREKAAAGRTVVMTLHDAGLAARFSDYAVLLFGNGEWQYGPTSEVLSAATMTRLYGVPVREIQWADGRTFVAV
ncbi:MAG: ABC transporter ATP-binding protein [Steroidobacteraceae bacterium]